MEAMYFDMRDFPGVDEVDYLLRNVDPQRGPHDLWISPDQLRLYLTPADLEVSMPSGPREGSPVEKFSFFVIKTFRLGSPHLGPQRIYNIRLLRELNRKVWQRWESYRISTGHEAIRRREFQEIDPKLLRLTSPAFFFCDMKLADLQEEHSQLQGEREVLLRAIAALSLVVDRTR